MHRSAVTARPERSAAGRGGERLFHQTPRSRPAFRDVSLVLALLDSRLMHLTIELDCEVDGFWIADIAELNVLLYAGSKEEAIRKAEAAAGEIIADRIAHGELPVEAANPEFAVAA
jgi:hypothetical protein